MTPPLMLLPAVPALLRQGVGNATSLRACRLQRSASIVCSSSSTDMIHACPAPDLKQPGQTPVPHDHARKGFAEPRWATLCICEP